MNRREIIFAAAFVALLAAFIWQHERWHELNARVQALNGKAEAIREICRPIGERRT